VRRPVALSEGPGGFDWGPGGFDWAGAGAGAGTGTGVGTGPTRLCPARSIVVPLLGLIHRNNRNLMVREIVGA
jgi:hypothetical protein